jgi:hypothetical protein
MFKKFLNSLKTPNNASLIEAIQKFKKGAAEWAKLKGRDLDDLFLNKEKQDDFMNTTFNFDKFDTKDWENYWTLAQHCDKNRDFKKKCLRNRNIGIIFFSS